MLKLTLSLTKTVTRPQFHHDNNFLLLNTSATVVRHYCCGEIVGL